MDLLERPQPHLARNADEYTEYSILRSLAGLGNSAIAIYSSTSRVRGQVVAQVRVSS